MEKEFGSEEPKQETTGKEFYESADKVITVERQETLEEAAERLYPTTINSFTDTGIDMSESERLIFIEGAKWQSERMYSEEEMYSALQKLRLVFKSGVQKWQEDFEFDLDRWFEQFKKK
jgi:hypothetical protein